MVKQAVGLISVSFDSFADVGVDVGLWLSTNSFCRRVV